MHEAGRQQGASRFRCASTFLLEVKSLSVANMWRGCRIGYLGGLPIDLELSDHRLHSTFSPHAVSSFSPRRCFPHQAAAKSSSSEEALGVL